MKGFGGRLLLFFIGLALIFMAGKTYVLMFVGTETTGHIYDVKVRETRDTDDFFNVKTEVSQYYTYKVNGEEHSGVNHITFSDAERKKNGGLYLYRQLDDLQNARTLKIRYLPFYPGLSASSKQTNQDITTILLNLLFALLGLFLIVKTFSRKRKSKAEKEVKSSAEPRIYPDHQQPQMQPRSQAKKPKTYRSAINFCPSCGSKVNGGKFCGSCGAQLR